MSSSSSPTPLTYTFYYSFSAPSPAELLALLIIHHVPNLPSDPLATTFVYRHVLDGSYTPFITPIASHPHASLSSLSRKKTHPTNNSPSFFGTLPPNQTPQHRLPLQHQLLASPGAAPTHRFVAFARSVISRFPLTLGRTLLFLASTVEPSFPLASHSNVERHILGASR